MNKEKLRGMREAKGESRFTLAVAVGTTTGTIENLERGATENPRVLLLKRLAEHFGVSVDDLLSDEK
ncbi:MAG: helix-turn-helix transcriptional regulator [Gordonibacter sp.]|uniref:helix-turn-helix transcriptional regulator n=1 Tax=Gordonibacter sp. TaxID=1968902 RepID=UPI002FC8C6FD